MSQTLRHPQILERARRDGKVSVEGLAAQFGVTLQTIRRDLADLAEAGRLERVHGGAVLPSGTVNIAYEERRALQAGSKAAIARTCASQIEPGSSLFLNIGTTTEAVARALLHHAGLMVVTNNMTVAQILSANPDCEVIVTGGQLRATDGGLTGPLAVESVRRFRLDLAVIGCSALDACGDMLDFDVDEVAVSQAILQQARRRILVADHTKFLRKAPARIGALYELDGMITDRPLPDALTQRCMDTGCRVMVAEFD